MHIPLSILMALVVLTGLFLFLLGCGFAYIPSCRRFAPLCQFMCLGLILGCMAGLMGEFGYDFIEKWLSRNLPIRPLARLIDLVYDGGYARYLGTLCGAAAAIWFWYIRPQKLMPYPANSPLKTDPRGRSFSLRGFAV
jgi:hypothetical protein